ncbi:MAG: zf-HC2 domain-containing protein [Chloroflexi bacterium]|nr:zf-HC2 domain-containing protein [Chloroflexota bacterium]
MARFSEKQDCQEVREQLSAYMDGQLTPSEKGSIDRHLASCQPCQEELASLRATKNVLSLMPSVATPRSFAIVSYRPARRAPAFSLLRLATAAAAFLLVLVGLGDFWGVYPRVPLPAPASPPVAAATPAPEATPAPVVATPEPRSSPAPSTFKPREPSFGIPTPTVATPAPEPPVSAATPAAEVPEKASPPVAGTAAPPAEGDYIWPVRQVQKGLVLAVVVLFGLSVIARQWAYTRARWR